MHADHAGCERVAPGNAAAAHDRDGAGGVDPAGKGAELLVRAAAHHAAAADEHRLFGLGDHLDEGVHVVEIRLGHLQAAGVGAAIERGKVAGGGVLLERQGLIVALGGRHVAGDVDEDGAGAAAAGEGEGVSHDVGELLHVAHHVGELRDGHRDAGDVDLLKGVLANETLGDVAGDEHHGRGVHIRRRDAGGEVCCAGAGRGEAHADLSGAAGIAVGRVGRALLVGCEDVGDFVVVIVERVVHVQDRSAGIAEDGIHALLEQTLEQDLCAGHFHIFLSSCCGCDDRVLEW